MGKSQATWSLQRLKMCKMLGNSYKQNILFSVMCNVFLDELEQAPAPGGASCWARVCLALWKPSPQYVCADALSVVWCSV